MIWTGNVILAILKFHIVNDGAEIKTHGGRKFLGSVTIGSEVAVAKVDERLLIAVLKRSV
jgi:hypothetical protein